MGVSAARGSASLAAGARRAARSPPRPPSGFREANDLARAGDYPKAIAVYGELAASGQESASLYWNWAQAATARGARARRSGRCCGRASSTRATAPSCATWSGCARR